ncbi:MAG TPA: hypothetical protein VK837_05595 [Longimicrobiales bacterium]|nr:hypothetical protein [Longimicrobiales bacterium]
MLPRIALVGAAFLLPRGGAAAQDTVPSPDAPAREAELDGPLRLPAHRFAIAVNDDQWLGVGIEVGFGSSPWAVHARLSPISAAPLRVAGVRRTLHQGSRSEVNALALGGMMSCVSLLDGPCPIEGRAEETYKPAVGGTLQWNAFGLGGSPDWAAGLEIGYVGRFADGRDPGFDLWTFGVVILRRVGEADLPR